LAGLLAGPFVTSNIRSANEDEFKQQDEWVISGKSSIKTEFKFNLPRIFTTGRYRRLAKTQRGKALRHDRRTAPASAKDESLTGGCAFGRR